MHVAAPVKIQRHIPAADRPSQNRADRFQSGRVYGGAGRPSRAGYPAARARTPGNATDMAHPPPLAAPAVRLEVRHGAARTVAYDVTGDEFVVGTVPGCDLRLSGANLPPVLCVVARHPDGPRLRKPAPALPLLLNGQPVQTASLQAGDVITLGP